MEKLKVIELFAGIGGIRLGFERAFKTDIETVYVSEWDTKAQETYRENFNDDFEIAGDITKIKESEIPDFDICLAGLPCQAFSSAGKHKGFNDDYKSENRGVLFRDVTRICKAHKPKVIFCENVKGLVTHNGGKTFKTIRLSFARLGYKVFWQVLNSKDFGVPQNRERVYIVAFRNDIAPKEFEFPKATDSSKRIIDILEKYPVPAKYYLSEKGFNCLKAHKERHEAKGNGFGYQIRDINGITGAIVCGGSGREGNLIIDSRQTDLPPTTNKEGVRKLTPREMARLQGFPDSFEFPLADTHLYKQLGNTVTVPVIAAVAENIKKVLKNT